ncbi:ribbon-helix-helix protein, CopG family [Corynebacterium sp. CNJ-954]|nr:ribbon-helix-helix protein, CopG family [Corynebacterium sp. CNJ-954]
MARQAPAVSRVPVRLDDVTIAALTERTKTERITARSKAIRAAIRQ